MKITIICDEDQKNELCSTAVNIENEITWKLNFPVEKSDVCIDLLFYDSPERISELNNAAEKLIIINGVTVDLKNLPEKFVRINGWPGFLKNISIEVAGKKEQVELSEKIFSLLGKKIENVPDIKGFITGRIISMIINEAYFALEENVSTKKEIDLAMKLGTNYPYGPFEWSEKIGLKNIYTLLDLISAENSRYTPSAMLKKEALLYEPNP
jgi:3-hydroxybutyryl-CoA dehydrogenase